jgi:site-specific recombinase XerD
VVRYWRANGLTSGSIAIYVRWVKRFYQSSNTVGSADACLTREKVVAFAKSYAMEAGTRTSVTSACVALHSWSLALSALGHAVPSWQTVCGAPQVLNPLAADFCDYQRQHRGIREASITKQVRHVQVFLRFLRRRRRSLSAITLRDVDAFVEAHRKHHALTGVADACSSVRAFLRFLHATERISEDLSQSVMAPVIRRNARPPRALPWSDVRRILRAIDRSTRTGRRDYALLLLMATYGMGAGEAIRLKLDDIDWQHGTFRVTRPKTGVSMKLPLLSPVARALIAYLRRGRPQPTSSREVFVLAKAPYTALTSSSAVRHILLKHANTAGVSAPYLGSHSLRHSHATRQVNQGAPPKVVSDILGHRCPESISAYARVALDRLRELALEVPRCP